MADKPRNSPPSLADLRREIDRIDEEMHALLMERGTIIDRLIKVKQTQESCSAFRPAREAEMMRRLVEPTRTQTLLTREQRAANVRRAFAIQAGCQLEGRRVILVDDVLTTGATTSACARALRNAGVQEVQVWTVARGL